MRKYLEITAGFILLIVGAIGGLIPVLQGWPFGIAGLVILARHFDWAKRTLAWARERWDRIRGKKNETAADSETIKEEASVKPHHADPH